SAQTGTMFERFTDQARQAVVDAQAEARTLQHGYIGTEHLLLGVLHDSTDLPAQALNPRGVNLDSARGQVQDIIGERHDDTTAEHLPFTPRAKTILEITLREAQQLGHDHIGSGHLLLALIHEGQGVAPQALTRLGAGLDDVAHDVLQQLPGQYTDTVAALRERVLSNQDAPTGDLPAAIAARLDSIDEKLTDLAARLEAVEHQLTDE
ncbi:MAG: Clp protease N-terminal domain-containing protein, partial [Nocardioidaceae bacterium]